MSGPYRSPPECDHGVSFDEAEWRRWHGSHVTSMPDQDVRRRWPRLEGECPKRCGYRGIAYASYLHYIAGDW